MSPGSVTPANRRPRRPALAIMAMEGPRAVGEYATFTASRPLLGRLPRGDGHPVLVLPGFAASDRSTLALRRQLRSWGYDAHGWELGRNVGPTDHILDGVEARLAALAPFRWTNLPRGPQVGGPARGPGAVVR